PDPARHPDRRSPVHEVPALLDMQLDEATDLLRSQPGLRILDLQPARDHRVVEPYAVSVPQAAGLLPGGRTDREPRPETRQPETRTLLLDEARGPDRPRRTESLLAEHLHGREPGHHPERPIVRSSVQHRVQVRPRDHAGDGYSLTFGTRHAGG